MQINMIGSGWRHTADFAKECPDGIHGMQLIVVRSKARICMGGREYRVGSNTAFIIESCFPHSIYADGEEYTDDFIRFDIEDDDSDFLDALGIEYNVPIAPDSDAASKLIAVCAEIYAADKPEKNESLKHIMRAIFTDYAHFSRVFKKYACVSPANYRKNKEQD